MKKVNKGDKCSMPGCNGIMIGEEGKLVCNQFSCLAYEVNDENYNLSRKERGIKK